MCLGTQCQSWGVCVGGGGAATLAQAAMLLPSAFPLPGGARSHAHAWRVGPRGAVSWSVESWNSLSCPALPLALHYKLLASEHRVPASDSGLARISKTPPLDPGLVEKLPFRVAVTLPQHPLPRSWHTEREPSSTSTERVGAQRCTHTWGGAPGPGPVRAACLGTHRSTHRWPSLAPGSSLHTLAPPAGAPPPSWPSPSISAAQAVVDISLG